MFFYRKKGIFNIKKIEFRHLSQNNSIGTHFKKQVNQKINYE